MVKNGLLGATLVLFSVASFTPLEALAEKPKNPAGKEDFQKGRRYFKAGEFRLSLKYFKKAYELSGRRPTTALAMAQCERILELYDDAIAHYEEYLASNPADAVRVRERLEAVIELRQQARAEEQRKATPPPPPPERPPPPPAPLPKKELPVEKTPPLEVKKTVAEDEPITSSPIFWIVSVAIVAGGAVALGVALSSGSDPYGGNTGIIARPLGPRGLPW